MKAYLSIDLDFWNGEDFPEKYFDRLLNTGLPITIVDEHHHLLQHIKQFEFDTIVNVDFHSDIVDNDKDEKGRFNISTELQCGTWANHIDGKNKHFIWSMPNIACYTKKTGTCHLDYNPFNFKNPERVCGWTRVSRRVRWHPRYKELVAIGIATSFGWTDDYLIRDFRRWEKKYSMLLQRKTA
jgi:hypothetical protein